MSLRATLWALDHAPVDDPRALLVVIALADEADDNGRGAGIGVKVIAERARCSVRTAQRRLADLYEAGVITLGDQRKVAHIPANHRPTVYDLSMHLNRGDSLTPLPARWDDSTVTPDPSRGDSRGDTRGDTADDSPVVPLSRTAACSAREPGDTPDQASTTPAPAPGPDGPPPSHTVSAAHLRDSLVADLADGLADRGLGVVTGWDTLTADERTEIADLVATHDVDPLVTAAAHRARNHPDGPPVHVRAWLPLWRQLRPPRRRRLTAIPGGLDQVNATTPGTAVAPRDAVAEMRRRTARRAGGTP